MCVSTKMRASKMKFGEWLRTRRKELKYSQESLAAKVCSLGVDITAGYISNLERGADTNKNGKPSRPSEDVADGIAAALDIDPNEVRALLGYAPVGKTDADTFTMPDGARILFQGGRKLSPEKRKRMELVFKIAYEQALALDDEE